MNGTENEVQLWWGELLKILNQGSNKQSLQSVYKKKLLGSRKSGMCTKEKWRDLRSNNILDLAAFVTGFDSTALSMTFVGELKARQEGEFKNAHYGQITDYMCRLKDYQPAREGVYGIVL